MKKRFEYFDIKNYIIWKIRTFVTYDLLLNNLLMFHLKNPDKKKFVSKKIAQKCSTFPVSETWLQAKTDCKIKQKPTRKQKGLQ